ncbi:hypothetical protein E2542_SST18855 [Spatholobus suberectus]|nr:hypothetical protein E2542_SST18855 [Spatholobus suberectus]
MNVSFGYVIIGDDTGATIANHGAPPNVLTSRENSLPLMDSDIKPSQVDRSVRCTGSLPSFTSHYYSSQNVDEVKDLHEVLPSPESARASSVDILYKNFDEEKSCSTLHDQPELEVFKDNLNPIKPAVCSSSDSEKEKPEENPANEGKTCSLVHDKCVSRKPGDSNGFSVVDQGIKFSSNEHVKLEESIIKDVVDAHTVDSTQTLDTAGIQESFRDHAKQDSLDELNYSSRESAVVHEFSNKKDDLCTKELILQELESALNSVSELEKMAMESPNIMEAKSEYKLRMSHSLDDVTESVASEFLSMPGIDHSPMGLSFESESDSPRERLLRQFEKEALSEGFSLFDFDTGNDNEADGGYDASFQSEQWKFSKGIKPASCEDVRSKHKVQMLEDLETEALMREWGLNEKAFQHSPPKDGFGSPIYFLPEEPTITSSSRGARSFSSDQRWGVSTVNESLTFQE